MCTYWSCPTSQFTVILSFLACRQPSNQLVISLATESVVLPKVGDDVLGRKVGAHSLVAHPNKSRELNAAKSQPVKMNYFKQVPTYIAHSYTKSSPKAHGSCLHEKLLAAPLYLSVAHKVAPSTAAVAPTHLLPRIAHHAPAQLLQGLLPLRLLLYLLQC
jgi:hypothetical protein